MGCWGKGIMGFFTNFINGLRKSFDGKDHLRQINNCKSCGKPSFFLTCLKCEMDETYRGWDKKWVLNHAQSVRHQKDMIGLGVRMMDIPQDILLVKDVEQNFNIKLI